MTSNIMHSNNSYWIRKGDTEIDILIHSSINKIYGYSEV